MFMTLIFLSLPTEAVYGKIKASTLTGMARKNLFSTFMVLTHALRMLYYVAYILCFSMNEYCVIDKVQVAMFSSHLALKRN